MASRSVFIALIILFIIIITFLFIRSTVKNKEKNEDYDFPDLDDFT